MGMEKRMKEYEEFMMVELSKTGRGLIRREKLIKYHLEMVRCFQHERLVHLIIMWWFILLSLGLLIVSGWTISLQLVDVAPLIPLWVLTAIMIVMTIFYVKHYYFLENEVQRLYDLTKRALEI